MKTIDLFNVLNEYSKYSSLVDVAKQLGFYIEKDLMNFSVEHMNDRKISNKFIVVGLEDKDIMNEIYSISKIQDENNYLFLTFDELEDVANFLNGVAVSKGMTLEYSPNSYNLVDIDKTPNKKTRESILKR